MARNKVQKRDYIRMLQKQIKDDLALSLNYDETDKLSDLVLDTIIASITPKDLNAAEDSAPSIIIPQMGVMEFKKKHVKGRVSPQGYQYDSYDKWILHLRRPQTFRLD